MKISPTVWRSGLLALALVILGACTRTVLPVDLQLIVARAPSAQPGQPAAVEGVEIDLALREGRSTLDAVYSVSRDGHMHLGFYKDVRHFYS